MTAKELIKKLKADGWIEVRQIGNQETDSSALFYFFLPHAILTS